jgi:MFS family permease
MVNTMIRRYYLFTFLLSLHFFSSVLVPFFTDWGHISKFQIQLLQSWFMICIFLLEIPTGVVADYLGRKYSIALGAITAACGSILYGLVPDFTVFLIAEFLLALGVALQSGADNALIYDTLKEAGEEEKSASIFGKAHAISMSGFLVSSLVGSFIAARFGLQAPILFSAIPSIMAACIALSLREPTIHVGPKESRRYLDIAIKGTRYFLSHKKLRQVAADATIVASAAYFVLWLYQPILQSLHVPIQTFGVFHAGLALIQIIIAANFLFFEKKLGGPVNFLRFSAFVTGASFLLVALHPSILSVSIFLLLAGGFGLTRFEYMSSYMNKLIPSSERATVLSSVSMFRRLSLIFLNPVVGFLAEGSLRSAYFFVGLLPLSLIPLYFFLVSRYGEESSS